jgi:isocitrate dehydrogenase
MPPTSRSTRGERSLPPQQTGNNTDTAPASVLDCLPVGFIDGDGIGPEVMGAARRVLDAAIGRTYRGERRIEWREILLGEKAVPRYGTLYPEESLRLIRELGIVLKGPLTTPVGRGIRSLNVSLRQDLNLYACIRPVKYIPGVPSPLKHPESIDIVLFRENTEDVYAGIEFPAASAEAEKLAGFLRTEFGREVPEYAALGLKPVSERGSKRLIRKAIRYAIEHGRRNVTLVHKGNIMKYTEGAFRDWGYEVALQEFGKHCITEEELQVRHRGRLPEGKILIQDRIADSMFQQMLLRPGEYDVIATLNLNGDYLSDAIAAEVGGIGIAPGANIGDTCAVFEATHGSAPKYAGLDKANPGSLIFSGVMLLKHVGWNEAATCIEQSYRAVIGRKVVTYDFARLLEGAQEVGTTAFADALVAAMS